MRSRLVLCAGRVSAQKSVMSKSCPSGALCSVGSIAWGVGVHGARKGTGGAAQERWGRADMEFLVRGPPPWPDLRGRGRGSAV